LYEEMAGIWAYVFECAPWRLNDRQNGERNFSVWNERFRGFREESAVDFLTGNREQGTGTREQGKKGTREQGNEGTGDGD
jgi:hypothetical protein